MKPTTPTESSAASSSTTPATNTAPATTPALEAEPRSPDEWARAAYPSTKRGRDVIAHKDFWQHEAAAALHGWPEHAYHEGKPFQLSATDYYKALEAATEPKPQTRTEKVMRDGKEVEVQVPAPAQYVPHFPALSKHSLLAKQFAALEAATKAARTAG